MLLWLYESRGDTVRSLWNDFKTEFLLGVISVDATSFRTCIIDPFVIIVPEISGTLDCPVLMNTKLSSTPSIYSKR